MTKKKKLLFLKRNITRFMNEAWDEASKKAAKNPTKIVPLQLPGLASYCEVKIPRRWYSVVNHSRKCFRRKK